MKLDIDWNKLVGTRDYAYINQREMEGDGFWKTYEKWFYFDRTNENYIIPTIIFCVIALFTNPIPIGIAGCFMLIGGALYLCHCNNRKLDMNPHIQKRRMEIRINNAKWIKEHGKLY